MKTKFHSHAAVTQKKMQGWGYVCLMFSCMQSSLPCLHTAIATPCFYCFGMAIPTSSYIFIKCFYNYRLVSLNLTHSLIIIVEVLHDVCKIIAYFYTLFR